MGGVSMSEKLGERESWNVVVVVSVALALVLALALASCSLTFDIREVQV